MTEARRCPQCGVELAAEELCPRCLLKQALQSQEGSDRGLEHFTPPEPRLLAGDFPQLDILDLLGWGGMGAVYKARQPGLERLVALKILPPPLGAIPSFAARFAQEARTLASLNHPNIVGIHDFGRSSTFYYFLMEFVDGTSLRQLLRTGTPKPQEVLQIILQLCAALQCAHDRGIVHRDVKPDNILLDRKGQVKIADFGLVKLLGRGPSSLTLTDPRQVMGTPRYMAPEQLERPATVDHRADIYALGMVFYEMLTGELPLGHFVPPSQKVQVDRRLDEVVLRALAKEPERRYQQVSDLRTDVEAIVRTPLPASAVEALEPVVLPLLPHRKVAAIRLCRDRLGLDLWEARDAVEGIARKHGVPLPPASWGNRLSALVLLGAGLALVLWLICRLDLSPIITGPLLLLLGVLPNAVLAWRFRGTPRGRRAAFWASILLYFTVGIPLLQTLAAPEPLLNHLYAWTGIKPGWHDVVFLQTLFLTGILGTLLWLIWFLRTLRAQDRSPAKR